MTEDESVSERETVQRHSRVVINDQNSGHSTSEEKNHDNSQEPGEKEVLNNPHSI